MLKYFLLVFLMAGMITSLRAAPLKQLPTNASAIEMALDMPLENRLQILKNRGPETLGELESLAFNSSKSLTDRWRAITSIARLYPIRGQKALEKAFKSSEWYLRNAATIGLKHAERSWAIRQAQLRLDDPALVVRTSAVDALKDLGSIESEALLWEKLYSSENFKKGKSLWVRKHIAEVLFKFARSGQETSFLKMLKDQDQRLHPIALNALNRIAGKKFTRNEWLKL